MDEERSENMGSEDSQLSEYVGSESEMEIDAHLQGEVGGEGDNSNEDGEFALRFKAHMNPFDFTEDDASGVQPFQRFERLEYEYIADRKRKALESDQRKESPKRSRSEDMFGASIDELMEAMNCSDRRKSRKRTKKRGRPKGSRNKLSTEIIRLRGDGNSHYANGRYKEAISAFSEVVRLVPNLPETYRSLGDVYEALGDKGKAMRFYMVAAQMRPKDLSLWKELTSWFLDQGNTRQAMKCLSKAIRADPQDIKLKHLSASLDIQLGNHEEAAKSFDQISRLCPDNFNACKKAAMSYHACGQTELAVSTLEDYLKCHPTGDDLSIVDMLATLCMKNDDHAKALQHIEHAQLLYCHGKKLPLHLAAKAGICHLHLGNSTEVENLFRDFQTENSCQHANLIKDIADSLKSFEHYESALNYYLMLERNQGQGHDIGNLDYQIAQCYYSLNRRERAIQFFYKALDSLDDSVDARLTLASLLLEEGKENEAIALLSPTELKLTEETNSNHSNLWWLSNKVKLKLANIYQSKLMLREFVDVLFPLINQSLTIEAANKGVKAKKKIPKSVLLERAKMLDVQQDDDLLQGFRPTASASDLLKATRAKRSLLKKSTMKEEMKEKATAAGIDWKSEDSDDEPLSRQERKKPPLPQLVNDVEHHQLIIDLCKALASLQKYEETLDIIKLTLKLASPKLSLERKEELLRLGVQVAYRIMDPKYGYDFVRDIVQQHPYSLAAWSCYYKVVSGLGIQHSRHSRLLHRLRDKHKDCIPPILILGHQFTAISQHQAAAKEYLEAYKLLPDSPFINLCVGTALINLALDIRLQKKHLCILQGLAFLYNNLRLCGESQEALYNIARAFHHVGLFSLAASYYEKVLVTPEKDCPIPKVLYENPDLSDIQMPGFCNIMREAAYNLHLIYQSSGVFDLARQVLRDHCTLYLAMVLYHAVDMARAIMQHHRCISMRNLLKMSDVLV